MTEKIKTFAFYLLIASAFIFVAGLLGGMIGYQKGKTTCPKVAHTDTIFMVDTFVYNHFHTDTVIKKVKVPYYVAVHDTLVDSVWVELPMEWHLASVKDTADVWYHGIMSAIDSMKFYCKNTIITNNVIKTEYKEPRLTLGLGAGALYQQRVVHPYLFSELRWNMPRTTFAAFGTIDPEGRWGAGLNVTYRINIVK